jgi:Na+/melibiose symporter-like transporter
MRNFLAGFATAWYGTGGFSWDVVTQMEIMGGVIPSFLANLPYDLINLASVAFVPLAMRHFNTDKRRGMLFFTVIDIVRAGVQFAVGALLIRRPFWFCLSFAIFWAINAADNAPSSVIEGEMNREISDYTEFMTGERPDGTQGLLPSLIMKVMAPLNALFTVAVFRWSGYDPLIPMGPYSQNNFTVYQKAYFLYVFAGCLPALVRILPLLFYDLVGEKREKMYIALNERRALVAAAQAVTSG